MPDKCVVFGCNNRPNKTERISLHPIPFEGADEPEKRKRRKKWIDFVKSKRAHWEPTKYSAVCSKHFRDDEYEVMFPGLTNFHLQRRLRKDGIGICVFPTIQAPCVSGESKLESKRAERKVRNALLNTHDKLVVFPRHLVFNKFLSRTNFVFANALMVFKSTFLKNVSPCLSLFRGRKTRWKVRTVLAKRK